MIGYILAYASSPLSGPPSFVLASKGSAGEAVAQTVGLPEGSHVTPLGSRTGYVANRRNKAVMFMKTKSNFRKLLILSRQGIDGLDGPKVRGFALTL